MREDLKAKVFLSFTSLETVDKVTAYKVKSLIRPPTCPSTVTFGNLLSKSAYNVDVLWEKWILYKMFIVYTKFGL